MNTQELAEIMLEGLQRRQVSDVAIAHGETTEGIGNWARSSEWRSARVYHWSVGFGAWVEEHSITIAPEQSLAWYAQRISDDRSSARHNPLTGEQLAIRAYPVVRVVVFNK